MSLFIESKVNKKIDFLYRKWSSSKIIVTKGLWADTDS